eukprot:TRINITY_DN6411_c0_g2_i1.p1 TRINITY_DN6411_c0_g2~~TRINITY_DN6411_c0_g2_i1.p1  ORF type:complete len:383 (+),score=65.81 TRINITY_DN6411_c0_g2_i1:292-1440(+)
MDLSEDVETHHHVRYRTTSSSTQSTATIRSNDTRPTRSNLFHSPELTEQQLSNPSSPSVPRVSARDVRISYPPQPPQLPRGRRMFPSDPPATAGRHDRNYRSTMMDAEHEQYLEGRAVCFTQNQDYTRPPPAIYTGTMSSSPPFGRAAISASQFVPRPMPPNRSGHVKQSQPPPQPAVVQPSRSLHQVAHPTSSTTIPVMFKPKSARPPPRAMDTGSPEPDGVVGFERQTGQQRRARRAVHEPSGPATRESEGLVKGKFYSMPEDQHDVLQEVEELLRNVEDFRDAEQRTERKLQQGQRDCWRASQMFREDFDLTSSSESTSSNKVEFKHKRKSSQGDSKWLLRDGCWIELRQPPPSPNFEKFTKDVPVVEKVKFRPHKNFL